MAISPISVAEFQKLLLATPQNPVEAVKSPAARIDCNFNQLAKAQQPDKHPDQRQIAEQNIQRLFEAKAILLKQYQFTQGKDSESPALELSFPAAYRMDEGHKVRYQEALKKHFDGKVPAYKGIENGEDAIEIPPGSEQEFIEAGAKVTLAWWEAKYPNDPEKGLAELQKALKNDAAFTVILRPANPELAERLTKGIEAKINTYLNQHSQKSAPEPSSSRVQAMRDKIGTHHLRHDAHALQNAEPANESVRKNTFKLTH